MAKLKANPITGADLTTFLNTDSDFAFEMKVLRWLENNGFCCRHSGTYRDPVTGKLRQFDIRSEITSGTGTLALAVECKNLRQNGPARRRVRTRAPARGITRTPRRFPPAPLSKPQPRAPAPHERRAGETRARAAAKSTSSAGEAPCTYTGVGADAA